jgi:hypothetical protein
LSSGSDLVVSNRSEHSLNPQVMEKPFLEDVGVSSSKFIVRTYKFILSLIFE